MFNHIDTYADAGRKAGQASKEQDWPRAQSWLDWYRRMIRLEHPFDKGKASRAFEHAYRQAASRMK